MKANLEKSLTSLARRGIVITLQRRLIVEFLHDNPGHWKAEDIFERLHERYGTLSRATVYKTLELLCNVGEITPIRAMRDVTHFDTNTSDHHHFLCRRCGALIDLDIQCPIKARCSVKGHCVEKALAIFEGVCAKCT